MIKEQNVMNIAVHITNIIYQVEDSQWSFSGMKWNIIFRSGPTLKERQ